MDTSKTLLCVSDNSREKAMTVLEYVITYCNLFNICMILANSRKI